MAHLNPLEKEFLIRRFRLNGRIKLSDFCTLHNVSDAAFRKWLKQYDEGGLEGLARADTEFREVLPEGIDRTEEAYKCFRFLGINSETRHQVRYRPRKVRDKYPNLIYSAWETVDRPRQVIVSDMTAFKVWYMYIEVTFYFDVFTKEILSYKVAERRGAREQYIDGLNDVAGLLKGTSEPVILHTDQGTVYASMAYNELIKDTNIIRSMSRAGKPTDNPVN